MQKNTKEKVLFIMSDPLWDCLDSSKSLSRDQLELVIQKKKINEVYSWFEEHFVTSSHINYISRCPIVIVQGPTGCGKTSTIKWISNKLKIPIKEYSETTDTTAINYDLAKTLRDGDKNNLTHSIDRRKAAKFEYFVINSIRYNTLYPTGESLADDAASEFDSDDLGFVEIISTSSTEKTPPRSGVIIHIETPLTFARSQRILTQSLYKLVKIIQDISRKTTRRVAIVFESLEGELETLTLATKIKQSLGIQTFKFNPITKANMKKLVESLVKNFKHMIFDKETIDLLISDSDGDIRACINSLQIICNRSTDLINKLNDNTNGAICDGLSPYHKKLKLNHEKVRQVRLSASLMRDHTRSLGFFHVLGKIFYQKRLYPDPDGIEDREHVVHRRIDRHFPTENSTEYLADLLDVEPKNLIMWLHQHYYKFCGNSNIDKASLFLENLSDVDTTCLSSTLSSQFYENHNILDQLQVYLAIESTVFSLYADQSNSIKQNQKKSLTKHGYKFIKSSVESLNPSNGELYSFNKPVVMSLSKVSTNHQTLLEKAATILERDSTRLDRTKLILDYVPYMNCLSMNWGRLSPGDKVKYSEEMRVSQQVFDDDNNRAILCTLENLEKEPDLERLEARQEKMLELIE